MKLLVLSRYSRLGASSRLRTMQYRPYLEEAGFETSYSSFFDDNYLENLYAGRRNRWASLGYYFSRFQSLLRGSRANLIWLEKEAFPWVPYQVEAPTMPFGVPIVSDHDDAIFHRYDQHPNTIVRKLLSKKIDNVMASSQLVTAGNRYLAKRAEGAGAPSIEIIPTVVDATRYRIAQREKTSQEVCVGWIGSPSTWKRHGEQLLNLVAGELVAHPVRYSIVGAGEPKSANHFTFHPWSEDREASLISDMDIGLMPLPDDLWSKGKCGYKLIQYMACGLPVIASPVGVNCEIVQHGVNGFLAGSEQEWVDYIKILTNDAELRRRMGLAGRKTIEEYYSIQVQGPRVAKLFKSIVEKDFGVVR